MRIIRGLSNLKTPIRRSAVTVGVFDGVHVGHRKIIGKVVARARAYGLESVVVTFDPHPLAVLGTGRKAPSLISLDHRLDLMKGLGVDTAVVISFAKSFAAMSAERFVGEVLVGSLGARFIYTGENFYFGRSASAGVARLKDIASSYGVKVESVKRVTVAGRAVSSSYIRKAISSGDLKTAEKLIGRPVSVFGTVMRGARFARFLGYPTANINPHHEVIPPAGVYAVRVRIGNTIRGGVLNIGTRPTFYSPRDREPSIEAHIFDFRSRIYGKDIEISFIRKIRDERVFSDAGSLAAQIEKDRSLALQICKDVLT